MSVEDVVRKISKQINVKPSELVEIIFNHPSLKSFKTEGSIGAMLLKMKGLGDSGQSGTGFFSSLSKALGKFVGAKRGDSSATSFFKGLSLPFVAAGKAVKAVDQGFKDLGVKPSEALSLAASIKGKDTDTGKKLSTSADIAKVIGRGASDRNVNSSPNASSYGHVSF